MNFHLSRLNIGQKLFIVGGVPIFIAGAIAAVAWTLILEAERARNGAVLSSENYHTFTLLNKARDDYVNEAANSRQGTEHKFTDLAGTAHRQLDELTALSRTPEQSDAIRTVSSNLETLSSQMTALMKIEGDLDERVRDMARRASSLVDLTDLARKRQQTENATLIAILTRTDTELERNQSVVTALGRLREAISAVELNKSRIGQPVFQIEFDELDSDLKQLDASVKALASAFAADEQADNAGSLDILSKSYWERSRNKNRSDGSTSEGFELIRTNQPSHALIEWCNARIKDNVTRQQRLHDQVADLIRESIASNEGELAAQNIALATLKLAQQTGAALAHRNAAEAKEILQESGALAGSARTIPLPRGIQDDMGAAIDGWRSQLSTTIDQVSEQNAMIRSMDRLAASTGRNALVLSKAFIEDANRLGIFIRQLLLFGAVGALLLGTAAAVGVARSITRPLRRLQTNMLLAADDVAVGRISDDGRPDELGEIARTTNFFLAEIIHREKGWRHAAKRADDALTTLKQAQDDLIRAEKLASLGQLVAGVSHEISTPLGIALTTATQMQVDALDFESFVAGGQISRSRLGHHASRLKEGSRILTSNLIRAADLLYSFKQVAVDQAREDRRTIEMRAWLDELLKSLGTLMRTGRHECRMECSPDVVLDTFPGILAQVVTNVVKNAVDHGLRDRTGGSIRIAVAPAREAGVSLLIHDDGAGIEPADLGRVFDPFFTTARSRGGTGLGLHIVHNLVVNKLQGRIDLSSSRGAGTTVRIWLPDTLSTSAETTIREPA
ncbi:sensor histidine kinase [Methylobacterium trifolii]|uniref:histidine kinase n=1 Tax=Methylobacterium trifolii TaxID=1003092 RepID=A0ABQ4U1L1_9HYPH|nr:HAMP domain-containing sensor histidine kinase [Methylobacterium trifolii]GJE60232.1 Adaptive-response sensory-kinase SasA [Methylobacterium trifolii]